MARITSTPTALQNLRADRTVAEVDSIPMAERLAMAVRASAEDAAILARAQVAMRFLLTGDEAVVARFVGPLVDMDEAADTQVQSAGEAVMRDCADPARAFVWLSDLVDCDDAVVSAAAAQLARTAGLTVE